MKGFKHVAALCILFLPVSAFAIGSATGTVTHIFVSATYGDIVYIELSGSKSNNPTCSTNSPSQFVIPRTSQLYADLFAQILAAYSTGASITVTGTGTCSVVSTEETIASVEN